MKCLKTFAFIVLYFVVSPLFSQTGPGGVGTANGSSVLALWLDANTINQSDGTEITEWNDSSGRSNTATAPAGDGPELTLSQINGYPQVEFSKSNFDYLGVSDHNSLKRNKISVFVVGNLTANSDSWGAFLSKTTDGAWDDGYALTRNGGNSSILGYVTDWNSNFVTANIGYGVNNIMTLDYDKSNVELFKNETTEGTDGYNSNILDSNSSLWLGYASGGYYLDGDIAEVIILKRNVNSSERIIISNYLSAKYDIPLNGNDLYTQDNPANGDFDHHVAGIGKASGSGYLDSQGTGIIRISKSGLAQNKFLFWGENTKDATYSFSLNTTDYKYYVDTMWRVSEPFGINDKLRVNIKKSDLNLPLTFGCAKLKLIVANNSNFTGPSLRVYPLTETDTEYVYNTNGLGFNDGDYFTLRYTDSIVWDGASSFHNGSGTLEAPSMADSCLKLVVKSGVEATLSANVHVLEIEVEAGAILEVADGVELSVEKSILNNGSIELLGEAQLIQKHLGNSQNTGTGKLKIRQQGTTNLYNYNYWSSPVNRNGSWQVGFLEQNNMPVNFHAAHDANPNTSPITLSSRWLYGYNASSAIGNYGWNSLSTTTPILPGIGHTMKGSGAPSTGEEYVFSGEANSGDYTYPVTAGYDFLVGNPYPSALNAVQFITDNLDVTNGTLYFYEQFESNNTHVALDYQGGYAALNLLTGIYAVSQLGNGGLSSIGAPTRNITVGQGFFVSIDTGGNLKFNNAQRVFAKESNGDSVFYREDLTNTNTNTDTDTRTKLWLSFTDPTGRSREIALGYDENATLGFDKGYDAIDYSDYPDKMLWHTPENLLVIQGLNGFSVEDEIPLTIKITTPGTYTIGLDRTLNFPESTAIYLKDNQENSFFNLKTEDLSLAFEAGTFNDRYSIVYQQETLSISTLEERQSVYVKFDKNTDTIQLLGVDNLNSIKAAYVYSVDGKRVKYISNLVAKVIPVSSLSAGVYILKLEMTSGASKNIRFVKY